ncbi:MAG TPA: hypothetical protein VH143_35855 [Kofleriaceae bacterium]|jgi:hypothetical protein|nr:hypothetical protein [Kofleriaceae bacterium]
MRASFDRVITPRAILVVGWALFVIYAFPGYMSYDSVWQLVQARHLAPINEWQPPLMVAIWRVLDHVVAGPFLMLVLQSGTFVIGLDTIMRRLVSNRVAAIVTVVVLLAPQTIIVMGVIWKDAQMAGFLLAAIAALLSPKRGWRVVGYVLLFAATGVRYNAAAATLPIVLALFASRPGRRRWRHYVLSIAAWLAITAGALAADAMLVEQKTYPWQTAAAPFDIAGVVRYAHKLDDAHLLADTEGVPWAHTDKIQIRVRMGYRPDGNILTLSDGPNAVFKYPTTDEQRDAIASAWKRMVLAHPRAFLRHRFAVFRALLTQYAGVWSGFVNAQWAIDDLGYKTTHSAIQAAWVGEMEKVADTPLFSGWVYFIVGIVLIPLCRRDRVAGVLVASALLYELGLFWVTPALDYRYVHWMVVATIIAAIRLFVLRYREGALRSHR